MSGQSVFARWFRPWLLSALLVAGGMRFSFAAAQTTPSASLQLSPASGTVTAGQVLTVAIQLNTNSNPVDAVDIRYLTYDPALFEVQDEDAAVLGVQILAGSLMPATAANSVDTAAGRISFAQAAAGGAQFQNTTLQTLATVRLRALGAGPATLAFSFTPGATTDTNVAANGQDILTSVTNGSYAVNPADTAPPAISQVQTTSVGPTVATLTWTTSEPATSQVEYGVSTTYSSASVLDATLVTSHAVTLSALSAGTAYHARVKSGDTAGNVAVSLDQAFSTSATPDTAVPAAVTNLAAANVGETSVQLTWTAPGDDGTTGTAASYELRAATPSLTEQTWQFAAVASGVPVPQAAGTAESFQLVGLNPNTTYAVGLRSRDEADNLSSLSNVVTFTTATSPGTPPPPQPQVVISAPAVGACLEHGQLVTVTWTRENVDHVALYLTADGGTVMPTFGQWVFMQNAGDTALTYQWTVPSDVTSDVVRLWVEGHDAAHRNRLAIDAQDGNIAISASCATPPAPAEPAPPTPAPAASSGGGGGGGGGGFFAPSDRTPPPAVTALTAQPADRQIVLSWSNPLNSADWVRTLVVRKTGVAPSSAADGTVVYVGREDHFTDVNLDNAVTYFYALYTIDRVPNYSVPVSGSATPVSGVTQINLTATDRSVDTDGDGLSDAREAVLGTNPAQADTDGDGFSDGVEIQFGHNPFAPPMAKPIRPATQARLRGRILLQVKGVAAVGQAYYYDPVSGKIIYLRNGQIAYQIMRRLGLGISDRDLARLPVNGSSQSVDRRVANRVKGRIVLLVKGENALGQAYYFDPVSGQGHYLPDGDAAYAIMRRLGLGVTTELIRSIPYQTPPE